MVVCGVVWCGVPAEPFGTGTNTVSCCVVLCRVVVCGVLCCVVNGCEQVYTHIKLAPTRRVKFVKIIIIDHQVGVVK